MTDRQARAAASPFNVMANPHGPICNLDCDYCYYIDKTSLFGDAGDASDYRMSGDVLETYVEQYIEAHPGDVVQFAWQGGEPTLAGREFFETVVRLQEEYAPPGTTVRNAVQTNGTLLDEAWCEFFRTHDFLVGISLDGPQELHDAYRTRPGGDGAFDDALAGLELLQDHDVAHNVLCTVHDYNVDYPLEVYEFFTERGVDWIQFIPIVNEVTDSPGPARSEGAEPSRPLGTPREPPRYEWARTRLANADGPSAAERTAVVEAASRAPVGPHSVGATDYGEFLIAVFDQWVREDVGSVSVQLFDQVFQDRLGQSPSLCVFSETCGRQLAVEHDGSVYACDHFVEPGFELGTVGDDHLGTLVESEALRRFGEYKRSGLPEYCRSCAVRSVCNGGCPKNRLVETPDGEGGLNYLCPSYRQFFTYVEPYANLVARTVERGDPIASVRDAVAELDRYFGAERSSPAE